MAAILLNLRSICVHLFSFFLLFTALIVAALQKAFSMFASLFASSSTYTAPSLPSSLPSITSGQEQLLKMGEDIKALITDHTFIHVWFIIVGVLGAVVLAAVLALITQSVMNVVGTVLAALTGLMLPKKNEEEKKNEGGAPVPVELEHEPAGGHEEHEEIEAEENDKDKEEIAKLKGVIQQQEMTLEEKTETIAAKDRALKRQEEELTIVETRVKKLKDLIHKASARKTEDSSLGGADLGTTNIRCKYVY
jgi:hypothetical protein